MLRAPREISGGRASEYQFFLVFLSGDVFFEFLAISEIGGLGRPLAIQLAGLIVEMPGIRAGKNVGPNM